MPVEDLNAEKMIVEAMNSVEAVETTTEFWSNNAGLPAILIVTILIIAMFIAVFVLAGYTISKALRK